MTFSECIQLSKPISSIWMVLGHSFNWHSVFTCICTYIYMRVYSWSYNYVIFQKKNYWYFTWTDFHSHFVVNSCISSCYNKFFYKYGIFLYILKPFISSPEGKHCSNLNSLIKVIFNNFKSKASIKRVHNGKFCLRILSYIKFQLFNITFDNSIEDYHTFIKEKCNFKKERINHSIDRAFVIFFIIQYYQKETVEENLWILYTDTR